MASPDRAPATSGVIAGRPSGPPTFLAAVARESEAEAAPPVAPSRQGGEAYSLADAVARLVGERDCMRLASSVDEATGVVRLSGIAPANGTLGDLAAALAALPGGTVVDRAAVLEMPVPCPLVALLAASETTLAPGLDADRAQPKRLTFTAGTPIVMPLLTPEFPSAVTIDVYTQDGTVVHLDAVGWPEGLLPADWTGKVGGADGIGLTVTAQAPAGHDLTVVIAAARALLPGPRPMSERADAYLAALRPALDAASRDGIPVAITTVLIETVLRDPVADGHAEADATPSPAQRR